METIHIDEVKEKLAEIEGKVSTLRILLESRILVGEINRPASPKPKREYVRKAKVQPPPPTYLGDTETNLPGGDKDNPFNNNPKKSRKTKTKETP